MREVTVRWGSAGLLRRYARLLRRRRRIDEALQQLEQLLDEAKQEELPVIRF
jgi:hypothetical protein